MIYFDFPRKEDKHWVLYQDQIAGCIKRDFTAYLMDAFNQLECSVPIIIRQDSARGSGIHKEVHIKQTYWRHVIEDNVQSLRFHPDPMKGEDRTGIELSHGCMVGNELDSLIHSMYLAIRFGYKARLPEWMSSAPPRVVKGYEKWTPKGREGLYYTIKWQLLTYQELESGGVGFLVETRFDEHWDEDQLVYIPQLKEDRDNEVD